MKKLFTSLILALLPVITFAQSIISVNPNSGIAGQTLDVTITGYDTHFDQGSETTVDFDFGFLQGSGTTMPNSITINSATSITANITIPSNTDYGDYDVNTFNNTDMNVALIAGFHVNGLNPALISISPNSGNAGQTLDVTITGNNTHFDQGSGTTVDFGFNQGSGTTVVNSININSATSITANITIPSNIYTGDYYLIVNNSTDGDVLIPGSIYGFHVNGITPPTLTAISPNIGNAGQTLDVTITGNNTHFDQGSGTTVDFEFGFLQGSGTTMANSITINSATSITANITIPSDTYSGYYVVNTYNDIDGYVSIQDGFFVNGINSPNLTSISPNVGNAGQTLDVTITGIDTHFDQGSGTIIYLGFSQGSGTTIVNSIIVNSATSITANITIPSNTFAGNYYVAVYDDLDGNISIYDGFHVNGTLNLTGYVIPTNISQNGTCDGSATIMITGGTAPYTYLYSSGSTNDWASDLCEGVHSVSVSDAYGNSLSIPFVISSPTNIFLNSDNYPDSTLVGNVYNSAIENCIINYSSIDSVSISNFAVLPNDFVSVTWNVVYGDSSVSIIDTYGLDSISGVYMLALQLYCPNKSIGQFLTAYDQIYFDKSLSGIDKIESNFISVYPNPFKDQITISLENDQASEVKISDISGKVIVNKKFNERVICLDMNELSADQYIVTVKNETSVITRKIVK